MNPTLIRIALVDDHVLVRQAWRMLLENNPLFEIVAETSNGKEAIEQAKQTNPDIMLVDINMSPMNGFEVAERMSSTLPSVKLIGLSVSNQPRYAAKMMELGAKGYLTKTSSLEEITAGIIKVFEGSHYICEEIRILMESTT